MNHVTVPSLTFQLGGLTQATMPDWATIIKIQAREQARAKEEEEYRNRRYTMGTYATPDLGYDDRLYVRLGCCKRKAYDLLEAGVISSVRIGNKYIVTEEAVREFLGSGKILNKVA